MEITAQRAKIPGRRELARAAAGMLALSAAISLAAVVGLPGEDAVEGRVERAGTREWVRDAAEAVIGLGAAPAVLLTVLAGSLAVWRRWGLRVALVVPATVLVAVVARASEVLLDGDAPSGHTAYVTAMFGLFVVLALDRGRRAAALLAALPVVAMGPAGVVMDYHSPLEVLAGYALGAGWLLALLATVAGRAGSGLGSRRHA